MPDWLLVRLAHLYCATYVRSHRLADWVLARFDRLYRDFRLGPFWSLALGGVVAIPRGSSYILRPPTDVASVEGLIAGAFVPYRLWGCLLVASAVAYIVGAVLEPDPRTKRQTSPHRFTSVELIGAKLAGVGHTVALGCYAALAFSGVASAVMNGLPWSAVGGYVLASLLHLVRVKESVQTVVIAHTRRFLLDGQDAPNLTGPGDRKWGA